MLSSAIKYHLEIYLGFIYWHSHELKASCDDRNAIPSAMRWPVLIARRRPYSNREAWHKRSHRAHFFISE